MTLTLIAAIDERNALGKDNDLIWNLPDDMKHFVSSTKGHAVIMGRKTFDSIGAKPLPKRHNVVITRDPHYSAEGVSVVNDLQSALDLVRDDDRPFIVGGAQIYALAMPHAQQLEITHIHHDFGDADAFFPEINHEEWKVVKEDFHPVDEKHEQSFTITRYERAAD